MFLSKWPFAGNIPCFTTKGEPILFSRMAHAPTSCGCLVCRYWRYGIIQLEWRHPTKCMGFFWWPTGRPSGTATRKVRLRLALFCWETRSKENLPSGSLKYQFVYLIRIFRCSYRTCWLRVFPAALLAPKTGARRRWRTVRFNFSRFKKSDWGVLTRGFVGE